MDRAGEVNVECWKLPRKLTRRGGLRRAESRLPEMAKVYPLIRHLWQVVVNERYRH